MTLPRGIRNNNPGNIRLVPGQRWLGQVPPERQTDPEFVQFEDMLYGLRALCRVLRTYIRRHGLRTVGEIVARWAPPPENDTDRYARFVGLRLQVAPNHPVRWEEEPEKVVRLVQAICAYECGPEWADYWPSHRVRRAAVMAGLIDDNALPETSVRAQLDDERPLGRTRTVRGARTAAGATAAIAALEALRGQLADAQGALAPLVPYLGIARWALLALVLVGVGVTVWARLDDRRKGLR